MPITDLLEKNCRLYGDDICLVEINPEMPETRRVTWKEYELIEPVALPITGVKLHGMYLTKKPTVLPTFFWSAVSRKATRLPSSS